MNKFKIIFSSFLLIIFNTLNAEPNIKVELDNDLITVTYPQKEINLFSHFVAANLDTINSICPTLSDDPCVINEDLTTTITQEMYDTLPEFFTPTYTVGDDFVIPANTLSFKDGGKFDYALIINNDDGYNYIDENNVVTTTSVVTMFWDNNKNDKQMLIKISEYSTNTNDGSTSTFTLDGLSTIKENNNLLKLNTDFKFIINNGAFIFNYQSELKEHDKNNNKVTVKSKKWPESNPSSMLELVANMDNDGAFVETSIMGTKERALLDTDGNVISHEINTGSGWTPVGTATAVNEGSEYYIDDSSFTTTFVTKIGVDGILYDIDNTVVNGTLTAVLIVANGDTMDNTFANVIGYGIYTDLNGDDNLDIEVDYFGDESLFGSSTETDDDSLDFYTYDSESQSFKKLSNIWLIPTTN